MDLPLPALGLAVAVLGITALLLAWFRFERTVAFRYLRRSRPATRLRAAAGGALGALAVGAALLALGRGRWQAEAAGAGLFFAGAVALLAMANLRLFSLFTTVATVGLALGVAALVVVLAVTSGFQRDFLDRVSAFAAHLVIALPDESSIDQAMPQIGKLREQLRDLPGVTSAAPFVVSLAEVMVGHGAAFLKAVDLRAGTPAVGRWMRAGSLSDLGRPAHCPGQPAAGRILLGSALAGQIKAKVGSCTSHSMSRSTRWPSCP